MGLFLTVYQAAHRWLRHVAPFSPVLKSISLGNGKGGKKQRPCSEGFLQVAHAAKRRAFQRHSSSAVCSPGSALLATASECRAPALLRRSMQGWSLFCFAWAHPIQTGPDARTQTSGMCLGSHSKSEGDCACREAGWEQNQD